MVLSQAVFRGSGLALRNLLYFWFAGQLPALKAVLPAAARANSRLENLIRGACHHAHIQPPRRAPALVCFVRGYKETLRGIPQSAMPDALHRARRGPRPDHRVRGERTARTSHRRPGGRRYTRRWTRTHRPQRAVRWAVRVLRRACPTHPAQTSAGERVRRGTSTLERQRRRLQRSSGRHQQQLVE